MYRNHAAGLLLSTLWLGACESESGVKVFNSEPLISITTPPDGTSYTEDEIVTFQATAQDSEDQEEDLLVTWSSDIDGVLLEGDNPDSEGFLEYITANLSPGTHAITATVWDTGAASGSSSITLVVIDLPDAPEISVVHPVSGEYAIEDEAYEFVALVSDAQDAPEELVVSISSDLEEDVVCEAIPDETGVASCEAVLSVGEHFLEFEALDTQGYASSATVYFEVKSGDLFDDDGDGYTEDQGDCNDSDSSVHPNADEYLNGTDDDCDGETDEGTLAYDNDGDCYCDYTACSGSINSNCVIVEAGDCDDADAGVNPEADEYCDGIDNDCDGDTDEDDAVDGTTWYGDSDGDGYGEFSASMTACSQPYGYSADDTDCDDYDATVYPGAAETCDGKDNDCDGSYDEGVTVTYYLDYDGDGYGVSTSSIEDCSQPAGYASQVGDCDDTNASAFPGATESCDGVDNNCDGIVDEASAVGCTTYYYDADSDGYGTTDTYAGQCLCSTSGYYTSTNDTDCYDYNSSAYPGQSGWSTSHRGDGSYDFDCDGNETKYYTSTGGCGGWPSCSTTTGWNSGVAACGSAASWIYDCDLDWTSCDKDTTTQQQYCN